MFIDESVIRELRQFHSAKTVNSKGNDVWKKVFTLGDNYATLTDVSARRLANGTPLFEFTFKQENRELLDTKVQFAPLTIGIFYPSQMLSELSSAMGHELKPIPDGYPVSSYLNAIYRRFKTLVGKDAHVYVRYRKVLIRDKYNRPIVEDDPRYGTITPLVAYRVEAAGFGSHEYDWSSAIIELTDVDKADFDTVNKHNSNVKEIT